MLEREEEAQIQFFEPLRHHGMQLTGRRLPCCCPVQSKGYIAGKSRGPPDVDANVCTTPVMAVPRASYCGTFLKGFWRWSFVVQALNVNVRFHVLCEHPEFSADFENFLAQVAPPHHAPLSMEQAGAHARAALQKANSLVGMPAQMRQGTCRCLSQNPAVHAAGLKCPELSAPWSALEYHLQAVRRQPQTLTTV